VTHVTQVLLNPEKPSDAMVDQPVLSSLVALANRTFANRSTYGCPRENSGCAGRHNKHRILRHLEAQRALHF
jgi:hypothetical protein